MFHPRSSVPLVIKLNVIVKMVQTKHLILIFQSSTNFLESLVALASTMLSYHRQQRVLTHPVVVHCLTGSGKTALFILLAAAMAEINLAGGKSERIIPDMVSCHNHLIPTI